MSKDEPRIDSIEVEMNDGKMKEVRIEVYTGFGNGTHDISFRASMNDDNEVVIKRGKHTHPWGNTLTRDPEDYANDITVARETAYAELEKRGFDDVDDWNSKLPGVRSF